MWQHLRNYLMERIGNEDIVSETNSVIVSVVKIKTTSLSNNNKDKNHKNNGIVIRCRPYSNTVVTSTPANHTHHVLP
ncbi:CLUMA_CG019734, isoform A [Clunio marinus]|uniref:CLUMA_CG019734, isoform A n=1 Tax=Clunio marinus TaxID=568069 RepID=A0A1J1J4Z1_9DIPT|nr:CLUMA_CG019734, isoform A [Clunio marinus]